MRILTKRFLRITAVETYSRFLLVSIFEIRINDQKCIRKSLLTNTPRGYNMFVMRIYPKGVYERGKI